MKSYDITDRYRMRTHTVRVTLQWKEYKGHISYDVGGNCRGLNVMDLDFDCIGEDEINMLIENDCDFRWNEEYEVFQMSLKDEKGNTCEFNDIEINEMADYVVAIEIVDCRLDEDN